MFSRIGRFPNRSSRHALNKGAISGSYRVRLAALAEISSGNGFAACENSGFLRSYLTSAGSGSGKLSEKLHHLKELDSTSTNSRLRRLFCNQAPKMKESVSVAGEQWNTTQPINKKIDIIQDTSIDDLFEWFLLICVALSSAFLIYLMPQQISFQEFKKELLEPGLVDHIVVSNKSVAKVFVKSSPANDNQTNAGDSNGTRRLPRDEYSFYFNIGSVKSFEEELEKAQDQSLGVDPQHYVPVTYDSKTLSDDCQSKMMYQDCRFMDELMKIGMSFLFGAFWGSAYIQGRQILNIGKADIMKLGFLSIVFAVAYIALLQMDKS